MAQSVPQRLTPETLETGVHDPRHWRRFSSEQGATVGMYGDQDISITNWCLEPGQENSTHTHPDRAQVIMVLEGSGVFLRSEGEPAVPINAGQCAIAPRGTVHGIKNTGRERMMYMTISSHQGSTGFAREPVGEQRVSLGQSGSGGHQQ